MRPLIVIVTALGTQACSMFVDAYDDYCAHSPQCDAGSSSSENGGGSGGAGGGSIGVDPPDGSADSSQPGDLSVPDTFNAGECLAAHVSQMNATLDGGGLVKFYGDSSCTQPVTTTGGGDFYFRADMFGSTTVSAGGAQRVVTAQAMLRIIGNNALTDGNIDCEDVGVALAVQAIGSGAPVAAFADAPVPLVPSDDFRWKTPSAFNCVFEGPDYFLAPIVAGTATTPLSVISYTGSCGGSATLSFASDAGLPAGLIASPDGGIITVYYGGFPSGHACATTDDCCGGGTALCSGTCR